MAAMKASAVNHRERRGSKAWVVSVTEKAPRGVRCGAGRRTQVNCRSSVESAQTTSKAGSEVAPRSAWTGPAYGPGGVRHRGSASLFRALTLNCGNLPRRWQAKGASPKGEADSSDAPSRDGAARSSDEAAVMAAERKRCFDRTFTSGSARASSDLQKEIRLVSRLDHTLEPNPSYSVRPEGVHHQWR